MDVTVSARHMNLTPALKEAAEIKIGRLARFLDGVERAEVHFCEERNPRIADKEICEVTLDGRGHHLRCKVTAADPFAAVDRAVGKLEQQLHTTKSKWMRRTHGDPKRLGAAPAG